MLLLAVLVMTSFALATSLIHLRKKNIFFKNKVEENIIYYKNTWQYLCCPPVSQNLETHDITTCLKLVINFCTSKKSFREMNFLSPVIKALTPKLPKNFYS
jgi:hypothetical protein